jgi:hypothetical protein
MSQYLYKKDFKSEHGSVKVKLLLLNFQDENGVHFIYSPHLDITGYGNSLKDAQESFDIVLDDFVDYTLKKKTIGKVLEKLGWKIKGAVKLPKRIIAPSISTIIGSNKYVSEIFDKYSVNTFHENIQIPTFI